MAIKNTMNIKFLGTHNCELQDAKLVSLLIDDSLVLDAGGLATLVENLDSPIALG